MKTAKRIFAVVLSVILTLAVFAFPASALDGNMSYSLQTEQESYAPGDTVTVSIYVSSDFNATCMRIPVLYSKDIFEISGDVRLTAYGDCLTFKNSLDVNTDVDSEAPIEMYNVSDYYDDSYGIVLIQWTASVTSSAINSFKSDDAVKCFSFRLKVKSDASGEGTILIPGADELKPAFAFYNQAVTDPTNALTICRVDNAQFSVDECTIYIDEGAVDGITAADGSDVIINVDSKIITNWFDGMDRTAIETNVVPVGNARLQFKASPLSGEYGTGSYINVFSGSSILAVYTNLLYGDVDGTGIIDAVDSSTVTRNVLGLVEFDGEIYEMAADIDGSGEIDAVDASAVSRAVLGLIEIDQSI